MKRQFALALAFLVVHLFQANSLAFDSFRESFNGEGPFSSTFVIHDGFDNAGWEVSGNGEFSGDGFRVVNSQSLPEEGEEDTIARLVSRQGSFTEMVTFHDVELGTVSEFSPPSSSSSILLLHQMEFATSVLNSIQISMLENDDNESEWSFLMRSGSFRTGGFFEGGDNISIGFSYDQMESEVIFHYDNDIFDTVPPRDFGPLPYDGSVTTNQLTYMDISAYEFGSNAATVVDWSLAYADEGLLGDFNSNGVLDANDIDELSTSIRRGGIDSRFDINSDDLVDSKDRTRLIKQLLNTFYGDANLDGEFNSSDFVSVFSAAEYDDNVALNSTWAEGDWNGDGDFNSRDLVFTFQDGGFEKGPRIGVSYVPEPKGLVHVLVGASMFVLIRRRF